MQKPIGECVCSEIVTERWVTFCIKFKTTQDAGCQIAVEMIWFEWYLLANDYIKLFDSEMDLNEIHMTEIRRNSLSVQSKQAKTNRPFLFVCVFFFLCVNFKCQTKTMIAIRRIWLIELELFVLNTFTKQDATRLKMYAHLCNLLVCSVFNAQMFCTFVASTRNPSI